IAYLCAATRRSLDFWHIDPMGVERVDHGRIEAADDVATLFVDLRRTIGIAPFTLARFLEETAQTLYADAWTRWRGRPRARELAASEHPEIERAMEGHPWIIANKGRLGFDAAELQAMTPESGAVMRLVWLGARKDRVHFAGVPGLDAETLYRAELGDEVDELRAEL